MKRFLSYFFPLTTRVNSVHNGVLDLTIINGKKILDSRNANYSYGSGQRILEFGLTKIDLGAVQSALLLGLGGGSIIKSLRDKFNFKNHITAVDFDEKIISIAENEFEISNSADLAIVNDDAFNFVRECNRRFDLVIIDLFIDNKVPEQFYSTDFGISVAQILSDKGSLIFNLGIANIFNVDSCDIKTYFENGGKYHTEIFKNIEGTNTIMILKPLPAASASHAV